MPADRYDPAAALALTGAHARLHLPAGAGPVAAAVRLEETPVPPDLPAEWLLRRAWRLAMAPERLLEGAPLHRPGELVLSAAGLAGAALEVRLFAERPGRWVPAPATWDAAVGAYRLPVWCSGTYALVANVAVERAAPVSAVIGPEGGTLVYARLHVAVPAGAVAGSTRVTIGPPPAPLPPWRGGLPFPFAITAERVEDGASLTELAAPLRLRLALGPADYGLTPPAALSLRRRATEGEGWEPIPATYDGEAVVAETHRLGAFVTESPDEQQPFDFGTNWLRADPFTGAATFAMPFELPPGPGGFAPPLTLIYNSQASHWAQRSNAINGANYGKGMQTASWVGEGFDIPIGYVQITTDLQNNTHYSANLFGQGFRLLQDSAGRWHTTDEQFWKIDQGPATDYALTPSVTYQWRIITPDGTKYFFGTAPDQIDYMVYYNFGLGSQFANRFMLSRVVDPNQNLVTISYLRLTKGLYCAASGSMTPAVYPTQICYGGQDATSLPYAVVFNRSGTPPHPLNGGQGVDRTDVNVTDWIDDGCTQLAFDINALASLDVLVNDQLARRYVFTTAHYAVPLLLQAVDLYGDANGAARERLLTVTYTPVLHDTDTPVNAGSGPNVTGNYVLLQRVTNAFGATTSFAYQFEGVGNFAGYEGGSTHEVLYNGRAVVATSVTVDPGFGGASRATNYSNYTNAQGNGDVNWPDFLGHAQATATDAASSTVSSFLQGQSPGRLTQATVSDLASPPNVLRQTTQTWTAQHLDPNATGVTWTPLTQKDVTQQAATKRETYAYTTTSQNGGQYGNLTDRYEYDLGQSATAWLRHTRRWFYPGVAADHSVVNRLANQNLYAYDPANPGGDGVITRSELRCYDGNTSYTTPIGGGADASYRGRLTAWRQDADLPYNGAYVDTTYGYDQWGNRTTQTRWNSYGTLGQLANTDGRTTTTSYDATYHAYRTSVTTPPTPTVPGGLVTQYGWDVVHSRQTSATDPNGQTTTHAYDGLGRRAGTWLPGDDPGQPGAATVTYRYLTGGGQPACVQVGRRKDAGGGAFGPRSYTWKHYDGTGRLIQTQADFARPPVLIRAQDMNDLLSAVTADGGTAPFSPVGAGTSVILASHFTQLQAAIQALWTTPPSPVPALGTLPGWSSGATPAGSPNPTPIYLSNLVDLRAWLNAYELWFNAYRQNLAPLTVHGWSNSAGTVTVTNCIYDNRGLLQRRSVPHLLTLNVPGQFQAGDWAAASTPATTSTYDAVQRPLTRLQPDGLATFRWLYTGWSTTLVDENNHQKMRTNDALGRLATVQDFTGTYPSASAFQTTSYAYSTADQLLTVTDATGKNVTSLTYDSLGRKTQAADPDLGTWTTSYNPIGTLATRTDAKNQTLNYTYDDLDRLSGKSGAGLSVGYGYDGGTNGLGRRTSLTDGAGAASYGYDARGRLTSLTRTINGSSYALSTSYDAQDRVLTSSYPNGDALAYAYGDDGRPMSLTLNGAPLVAGAAYNALGQPTSLPLGNSLATAWRYYALDQTPPNPNQWYGRLYSLATGGVQNQTITSYDAVGNLTGIAYADHTAESFAASYNEWDQLTSYGSLEGYRYLAGSPSYDIGTLQTKGADAYTYPAPGQPAPHAPTSVSPLGSYGYDQNGNRSSDPTATYTYDAEQQLTQVTQSGSAVLANSYDGDGARLVRTANGVTTHYAGGWYEANPATGVGTAYYPFNGMPVAMKDGATLSYLHHDHLGSLVSATDASGNELGWARYLPFGGLRLSGGTLPTDRLFTGQTRDLGSDGFYFFKARYYDGTLGQFQSPDLALPKYVQGPQDRRPPQGPADPQTLNRYTYARNNPLRLTDRTGLDPMDPNWVQQFEAAHGGRAPTEQDWQDYLFAQTHPGSGPGGTWLAQDWQVFANLRHTLGSALARTTLGELLQELPAALRAGASAVGIEVLSTVGDTLAGQVGFDLIYSIATHRLALFALFGVGAGEGDDFGGSVLFIYNLHDVREFAGPSVTASIQGGVGPLHFEVGAVRAYPGYGNLYAYALALANVGVSVFAGVTTDILLYEADIETGQAGFGVFGLPN